MEANQLELPKPKAKRRRNRWGKAGDLFYSGGFVWQTMPDLTTRCLGSVEAVAKEKGEAESPQNKPHVAPESLLPPGGRK